MQITPQIPLYQQIVDNIRQRILNGELPEGHKLPSERDMAIELGVNRLTVNKAFNVLKKQNLICRSQGKGTFVSREPVAARKCARIWMWGITPGSSGIGNPYMQELFSSIRDVFTGHDIEMVFLDHRDHLLEHCRNHRLDGLMLFAPRQPLAIEIARTGLAGIPHVILAAPFAEFTDKRFITIDIDNDKVTREAARYLTDLGHKRIAILSDRERSMHAELRLRAFRGLMRERGLACPEELVFFSQDFRRTAEECHTFVRKLLERDRKVTAVFAAGFPHSLGAIRAIQDLGLRTPESMSILGFDDFPQTGFLMPGLTAVRQPVARMGVIAAQMLLEQLTTGRTTPGRRVLCAKLIIRESCGAPFARNI